MRFIDVSERLPDIGRPDDVLLQDTAGGLLITVMAVAFSIMRAAGMAFVSMAVALFNTNNCLMMMVRNDIMRQQNDAANE